MNKGGKRALKNREKMKKRSKKEKKKKDEKRAIRHGEKLISLVILHE